jgi:type IV pilus assembly protein PilF
MARWLMLLLALAVAGCNQQLVREDDETGKLGAVEKRESPSDTYVQLAAEYLRLGNYATALSKAKKAVRADSGNADAYLVLGLVYERLGETDKALAAYRKGVSADDHNPYVLNAYGTLLCKQGEYKASLRAFDQALQNPLYETPWVALTNAAHCALQAGDQAKAEKYALRALQANPRFAPALALMARISYEQGKYLSARAYIQRFREVARPTAELLYLSILTERKLGDLDQVRSDELLLKAEYPDSEEARKIAQ